MQEDFCGYGRSSGREIQLMQIGKVIAMGKQQSKEEKKEEVIITQSGQNNFAPNSIPSFEKTTDTYNLTIAIVVICAIILAYMIYKKLHKRLTKKIERQSTAAVLRSQRLSV